MQFKLNENTGFKLLNVGPVEDRIIRDGIKGAKSTLDTLDHWALTHPEIKSSLYTLHSLYQKLDSGFVNKVTSMDTYLKTLKSWLRSDTDTKTLKLNIADLDKSLNQNILFAHHENTKRKRIVEKNVILQYWTSHINQLSDLLTFRNKVQEVISRLS